MRESFAQDPEDVSPTRSDTRQTRARRRPRPGQAPPVVIMAILKNLLKLLQPSFSITPPPPPRHWQTKTPRIPRGSSSGNSITACSSKQGNQSHMQLEDPAAWCCAEVQPSEQPRILRDDGHRRRNFSRKFRHLEAIVPCSIEKRSLFSLEGNPWAQLPQSAKEGGWCLCP